MVINKQVLSNSYINIKKLGFRKDVEYGGGIPSLLGNIIWIILFGIPMAIENFIFGCIWCITIVGIPFGLQFFKIARLALTPFGSS